MESLKSYHNRLQSLQHQAERLTATGLSLITLFAEEANRLSREDEASRLRTLYHTLTEQLGQVKRDEDSASYGHSKARLVASLGGLVVGVAIKMASKDKQLSAFSDHLLNNLGGKRLPFGLVFVFIGPKGLPDDARVVSIARLARESNREESEVINELQERGYLLFSEEAFPLLIDKLTDDVQEGRLLLPVPTEKLAEIRTSSWVKLETKKPRWVPSSRPQ